ncbi:MULTISPECIES: IS110 family transposase [Marivivens]|jgi:transposase|uniref:IS110 family transposase n=1 Tax=Marivivens TaxID=1759396 RepID=UPI0007FECC78|nr:MULTISPECIES: IS110 family transposase [Marivivens]MCL7407249.1 IS110 family transposase [Marivivens geojensis]OBR35988.1 transposase [Donghicola sp. JL3646]APO87480.1 IS110 family transposase [Marivivens sp. JLT3646]MCL7407461.1 IS110 family transposase [Marivivens donghaensis]MDN3704560.1 IS110 family transposase [Marivivens donghaensis]
MEYFVGLDVSLRSCALCILDGRGKVCMERELPCEVDEIVNCLNAFGHPIVRIGFEAGALSQYLFFGLKDKGFEIVCMEARQVSAALSAMRNKTDKTDAKGIAQILRTGWFSPVHMKSREAHGLRALLSTRKALLKKTMDLANEVRGLLKIFGVRLPRTVKHGSFDDLVRPMIEMDEVLAHAVIPLLDARAVLFQHYLELDRRVKHAASQDEVCMRMMTVPGVGPIAALTFKAAVDDPNRFKRSRTVAAHFGLTPRRYQSGEHDNPGRISKAGDQNVRATLYAAANALLMRTMAGSQIKSWGMRLMRTKGRRRAVVAVARKLAVLLHRMWIDGTEFRQEKVGGQA